MIATPPARLAVRAEDVPRDLAAIVDKAMARDAADRYPSALELADDLRRFADGRLVSVHTYWLGALLRRWVSRHRAPFGVAATMLAVLAITGTLSVRRIVHERDRADAEKALAERARASADVQREAAEQLVEFMVGDLKDRLQKVGRLDALEGVAENVRQYFETAAPGDEGLSVDALERRATAFGNLAQVAHMKRDLPTALHLYERALALLERAMTKAPDDPEPPRRAAQLLMRLGLTQADSSQRDAALASYRRGIALADAWQEREPSEPRWKTQAAWLRSRVARVLVADGKADEGYAIGVGVCETWDRVTTGQPPKRDWEYGRGWAYFDLGIAAIAKNDLDDAARAYAVSLDVRRRLVADHPDDASLPRDLIASETKVADAEWRRGRPAAALPLASSAVVRGRALVAKDPEDSDWAATLANALHTRCPAERLLSTLGDARRDCAEAVDLVGHVVELHADDAARTEDLAADLTDLSDVDLALGDTARALQASRAAVAGTARMAAKEPTSQRWQTDLAEQLRGLARVALARGDVETADDACRRSLASERATEATAPTRGRALADAQACVGDVAAARGDVPAAITAYAAATARMDEALEHAVGDAEDDVDRAEILGKLARVYSRGGRTDEARAARARALAIVDGLRAGGRLYPSREGLARELAHATH